MSINDLSRSEHNELARANKINSDIKNNTDALTFGNTRSISSHGIAAKKVRDLKAAAEIERLEKCGSSEDLFNYLLEDDLLGF